jgi:hypothetical protein
MANLTDALQLNSRGEIRIQKLPMLTNIKIWKGALVVYDAAGFIANGSDTAGVKFAGIANETVDNTGGASGAKSIEVANGEFQYPASSLEQADAGRLAYIGADNQTITDAGGATNDIPCGTIVEFTSATLAWINTLAIPAVASA